MTSIPCGTPPSMPNWMMLFAFFASLGLTILFFIEALCRSLRKATLEVVLTREVFYRLLDSGECLYANAVLVSYDSGALVLDIEALLSKHNGATKNFNLRIAQIGEKYRLSDGTYQFSFHSTSPLSFIPIDNPQRIVYICEQESYANATRTSFSEFNRQLSEIKIQYETIEDPDDNAIVQLGDNVTTLINDIHAQIMDQIQMEPGEYQLTIKVKYRQKRKILPLFKEKFASSSVCFSVEQNAREYFRYMLRKSLEQKAANTLFNQTNPEPVPEYTPQNIVEMSG